MQYLDDLMELVSTIAPFLGVVLVVVLSLTGIHRVFLRKDLPQGSEHRLRRQLIFAALSAFGAVLIVLALPVTDTQRNLVLTGLGLLVSGTIAVSSTTIVANAMAGLMLRTTMRFQTGDFIHVGTQFGRVAELGILDTEIQTEDRELTTLPNLYLISNPVTVVRSSGTLVSANLSLGYDVHHSRVESLLLDAARKAELDKPFVRILELGNFSVTYRVSGFLADVKNLLTVRSNLHKFVIDVLHANRIEIVSPTFMNQRQLSPDTHVIPAPARKPTSGDEELAAEDLMFDKAERAKHLEAEQLKLQTEIKELEARLADTKADERQQLEETLALRRAQLKTLESTAKSHRYATLLNPRDAESP